MNVTLLGLGSVLMQDEGVGVHAVKYIQEQYETPGLEIVDGGTCGLDLLPYIEKRDRLLVVDAVNFGEEPGYIGVLRNEEVPAFFGVKASLHHLGLTDVLATAQLLDIAPREICLIGIQPQNITLGLELSELIQEKLGILVEQIVKQLEAWGIGCRKRQTGDRRSGDLDRGPWTPGPQGRRQ
jgi:hydrogenase maturation protease